MLEDIKKLKKSLRISVKKNFIPNTIKKKLDNNYDEFKNTNIINYLSDIKKGNYRYNKNILSNDSFSNNEKISYYFKGVEVSLDLYYNKVSNKLVKELLDIINFCIILLKKINKSSQLNYIKIFIFFVNKKKFINVNKKNQLITENINSGYTNHSYDFFKNDYSISNNSFELENNYIVIYRLEEIKKVLIHELIHLFKIHTCCENKIDYEINKLINIYGNDFSIYEAYTETLATIIYSYYYSKLNNLDLNDILNKQLLFSYFQSAKILYNQKIYNISGLDLENPITINETTNAVSYYILKCAILNNLNLFKKIFSKKRNYLLNSETKIINFDKYIVRSIMKEDFKENMNKILLKLIKMNKLNNIGSNEKKLLKTFRMNILD